MRNLDHLWKFIKKPVILSQTSRLRKFFPKLVIQKLQKIDTQRFNQFQIILISSTIKNWVQIVTIVFRSSYNEFYDFSEFIGKFDFAELNIDF